MNLSHLSDLIKNIKFHLFYQILCFVNKAKDLLRYMTNQNSSVINCQPNDRIPNRGLTTTVLCIYLILLLSIGLSRDNTDFGHNIWCGHTSLALLLLLVSALVVTDVAFTRPHPCVWRTVFGLSLIYLLDLLFILSQNHSTVKSIIYWFYPNLESVTNVFEEVTEKIELIKII